MLQAKNPSSLKENIMLDRFAHRIKFPFRERALLLTKPRVALRLTLGWYQSPR